MMNFLKRKNRISEGIRIEVQLDPGDPAIKHYLVDFCGTGVQVRFAEADFKELRDRMSEAIEGASKIYRNRFQTAYPF